MLSVVKSASQMRPDGSGGLIVIESDRIGPPFNGAFDELKSREATNLAQDYAARKGCALAAVNGNIIGPYPVNSDGISLEQIKEANGDPVPMSDPRMQAHRYRVDVPVVRPMR